jgi:hypothetical protein
MKLTLLFQPQSEIKRDMKRGLAFALLILAPTLASCARPDRKTFADSWKAAVEKNDPRSAWGLFDRAARERILAGLKRSQEKAQRDEEFRNLFAYVNAPADTNLPPEELAVALLGQHLDQAEVVDDGKTGLMHIEDGKWRASVEPVGFVDPDGVPLTLSVRLPAEGTAAVAPAAPAPVFFRQEEPDPQVGQELLDVWSMKDSQGEDPSKMTPQEQRLMMVNGRLVKDNIMGFVIHTSWNGKRREEIQDQHAKIAAVVAERVKLRNGFEPSLKKIMDYYGEKLGHNTVDYAFEVDTSGGITPSLAETVPPYYNRVAKPQPRLAFVSWPSAR